MKIVIAPDSFKECLTAAQVAQAIETGLKQVLPDAEYIKVPVADGGEGTLQSLVDATDGRLIEVPVTGPMEETVQASYGLLGDGETAVIEMARASGIELVAAHQRTYAGYCNQKTTNIVIISQLLYLIVVVTDTLIQCFQLLAVIMNQRAFQIV